MESLRMLQRGRQLLGGRCLTGNFNQQIATILFGSHPSRAENTWDLALPFSFGVPFTHKSMGILGPRKPGRAQLSVEIDVEVSILLLLLLV